MERRPFRAGVLKPIAIPSDFPDVNPNGRSPKQPDRREAPADRRARPRGGRRRADWPEDAGITSCTRCGYAHPTLVTINGTDCEWYCAGCRHTFVTRRAGRVVL